MSRKSFLQALGGGMFFSASSGPGGGSPALGEASAEARRLKITAVDIYAFNIPLQSPFKISIGTVEAANDVLVAVRTDAGLTGLGEACPFPPITGETQETNLAAAKALRGVVLGRDPLAIETLGREFGPFVHSNPGAAAAFETALFDILGQLAGLPLYRLFGGDKTAFDSDITADLDDPPAMAARAKDFVARGHKFLKVKVGQGEEIDLRRLAAIREAVGDGPRIRIDANQGWDVPTAVATLRRMERFRIEFVEQPVVASDLAGLRAVREASPIPVMADEAVFGPADVIKVIRAEACQSINIKLMKAGGLLAMMKMAHAADAANMSAMVGCMLESRLALTAAAHVVAANRNILYADLDGHTSHTTDPIVGGMRYESGRITLPEGPGIGASVDPDFLKRCPKI